MTIRNSKHYESLVRMAGSERLSWGGITLAGRGIAAYSRAQLWMLNTGKSSVEAMRLADLICEFEEIVEPLLGLWVRHVDNAISDEDFCTSLKGIIERLELWPNLSL